MIPKAGATETVAYTAPPLGDILDLNRRKRAAGYAHIARLAVDGGPVVEPKPIRRRLTLQIAALISIGVCAIGAVVVLYGMMG